MGRLRRVDLDEHAARLVGVANEAHGFFRGHSDSRLQQEIKRVVRVVQVHMLMSVVILVLGVFISV